MIQFFKNLFGNKEKKRQLSLLEYFTFQKFTFPINNFTTYSHASAKDIEFLFKTIHNLEVKNFINKKYNFVYKLTNTFNNITEVVYIVDESAVNGLVDLVNILLDVINMVESTKPTLIKTDNIIKVNFNTK